MRRRQEWIAARTPTEEALDIDVWVVEDFSRSPRLNTTTFEEFLITTYFDRWVSSFYPRYPKWMHTTEEDEEYREMPVVLKAWLERDTATRAIVGSCR
jgi:hypothetical protein